MSKRTHDRIDEDNPHGSTQDSLQSAPPENLDDWGDALKPLESMIPSFIHPSEDAAIAALFHRVQVPPTHPHSARHKVFKLSAEKEDKLRRILLQHSSNRSASTSLPASVPASSNSVTPVRSESVAQRQLALAQQYKQQRNAFRTALLQPNHPALDSLGYLLEQKVDDARQALALQDQVSQIRVNSYDRFTQKTANLMALLEEERQSIDDPVNPKRPVYLEPNVFGVKLVSPIRLFQHQIEMVRWLKDRESAVHPHYVPGQGGGIMAMEMGLGKTLCIICLIASTLTEQRRQGSPSIYVCPKSLLFQVRQEFVKFTGSQMKLMIYHRDALGSLIDTVTFKDLLTMDVILTTYEGLRGVVSAGMRSDGLRFGRVNRQCVPPSVLSSTEDSETASDIGDNVPGRTAFFKQWLRQAWFRIVLDESHMIREQKTLVFKTICQLKSPRRFCSTGTPLHNSIRDVFSQLMFTGLVIPPNRTKRLGKHTLTELCAWSCLNFVEESVLQDVKLPVKRTQVVYFDLSPNERSVYTFYKLRTIESLESLKQFGVSKEKQTCCALTNFTRMLQVCNSAFISLPADVRASIAPSTAAFTRSNEDSMNLMDLVHRQLPTSTVDSTASTGVNVREFHLFPWMIQRDSDAGIYSSKMRQIVRTVEQIHSEEPAAKILVFTNHVQSLHMVMDAFARAGKTPAQVASIHGGKSMHERHGEVLRFQSDPQTVLLFMTLKTGGTGLNLTEAHHVIFVDPWPTYAPLYQAEKRSHRIGQTQPVFVYYILARNTVEEGVYAKAMERKSEAEDISKVREHGSVISADYIQTLITGEDIQMGRRQELEHQQQQEQSVGQDTEMSSSDAVQQQQLMMFDELLA
jgi:SNF2 family DNA or RNA helicase